jgi:hypothetical protein
MLSDKAQLVSRALGRPVDEWIAQHRAQKMSYRRMVAELYKASGYNVTHQTLVNWDPTR